MAVIMRDDGGFDITNDDGQVVETRYAGGGGSRASPIATTGPVSVEDTRIVRRTDRSIGRDRNSNYDGIYPGEVETRDLVFRGQTPDDVLRQGNITAQQVPALSLASVIAALGPVGIAIVRWIASTGAVFGSRISWSQLPAWARTALIAVGATVGSDLIFDTDEGEFDQGIIPIGPILPDFITGQRSNIPPPPDGNDEDSKLVRALYVGGWYAGMAIFYRLSNGKLATRNKHGVWTIWRPKKPIVLFTTGNRDLQDLFRADNLLDKEAKKMEKLLRRRGKQVRNKVNRKDEGD